MNKSDGPVNISSAENVSIPVSKEAGLESVLPRVAGAQVKRDFITILLNSCELVVICSSLLFICYVFRAIIKIQAHELKSKLLLINALVADALLSTCQCVPIFLYIAMSFGLHENGERFCIDRIGAIAASVSQYAQPASSLLLVCDRLYAVLAPLRYHVAGYSTCGIASVIVGMWLACIAFVMPIFTARNDAIEDVCLRLAIAHQDWNNKVRFPIVISIAVLVFFIYGILFAIIKLHRIPTESITFKDSTKRKSLSLALTFFAAHLSYLLLFIPAPAYAILIKFGYVRSTLSVTWRIRRALILLYLFNSVVDPVIMATRIPAIRGQLLRVWNNGGPRRNTRTISQNVTTDT